jgi:hypothetical protein
MIVTTCDTCGALVDETQQDKHAAWHETAGH